MDILCTCAVTCDDGMTTIGWPKCPQTIFGPFYQQNYYEVVLVFNAIFNTSSDSI